MASHSTEADGAPRESCMSSRLVRGIGVGLFGIGLLGVSVFAGTTRPSASMASSLHKLRGEGSGSPTPLLGDGSAVDWWFAFKPTTDVFPSCTSQITCMFGGDKGAFKNAGLQYILASSKSGKTSAMQLHSDCLGNGADPVAKTFAQVFSGGAANYVIWNDQFYADPILNVKPKCVKECESPWGHSKGVMAWGADGTGFVMQVSTPDWPGSGSKSKTRQQGNTLGCCQDENIKVAQHFFALRLATADDTRLVLQALQRASVATDPSNEQIVKLTSGPSELASLAKQLGQVVRDNTAPLQGTLSIKAAGGPIRLFAKPSFLHVPPWHMVSSLLGGQSLRTATWWQHPEINSTKAGFKPSCWDPSLKSSPGEVQSAVTGQWNGKKFKLSGNPTKNANHAKLGVSLSGSKVSVMGDMNQQGSLGLAGDDKCDASQNGRGGMFFVVEDDVLHTGLSTLMVGETANYVGGHPAPPAPTPPPGPSPPPGPQPAPSTCGGAGKSHKSCHKDGCTYVKKADAKACGVEGFGCYSSNSLSPSCPKSLESELVA